MDAQTVHREALELADFASPEVINVLAKAADDDETWAKAAGDAKGYLREAGIEVPDGVEIALEQVFLRNDPQPCTEPGNVRVGRPGGVVCTKTIQLYVQRSNKVHAIPTLKLCAKWETVPWVDGGCVPISSLLERG